MGEGYPTPTNERHCVNSVSLNFSEKTEDEAWKESEEKKIDKGEKKQNGSA